MPTQLCRRALGTAWPVVASLLMVLAVALATGGYTRTETSFDSDDLTLVNFCDDVLAGRNLTGWHLPGAPYLFPDVALLLPCRLFISDVSALFLAWSLLFYSLEALALAWLGRQLGLSWRDAWSCACLGVALLLAMNLGIAYRWRLMQLPRPNSHLGVIPVGLAFAAYLLHSFREGFTWWSALLCSVLVGLTVFSDRLLVVQFLAPAAGSVILVWLLGGVSTRRALLAGVILAAAVGIGIGTHQLCVRMGIRFIVLDLFESPTLASLVKQAKGLVNATWGQRALYGVVPACYALALAAALLGGLRLRRGKGPAMAFTGLLVVLVGLSCVVPMSVMTKCPTDGFERYVYTLTVLPALLVTLLWNCFFLERGRSLALLGQSAVALFVVVQLSRDVDRSGLPVIEQPYPPLARALDELASEKNCRRGLAGYWHARRLTYLTRNHVAVLPALVNGSPFVHGNNPDDYVSSDPKGLQAEECQFVVVDTTPSPWPQAKLIRQEFGEPREKRVVGTDEVWVYDRLDNANWRQYLVSLQARRLERTGQGMGPARPRRLAKVRDGFRKRRNSDSAVVLEPGGKVEVSYATPVRATVLDVAGEYEARFTVTLFLRDKQLAVLSVPVVTWPGSGVAYGPPGVRSRLVPLPPSLHEQEWDRAVVQYHGFKPGALTHFLAFSDTNLVTEIGLPVPTTRRFEAEAMLSQAPPTSVEADPKASAGKVRGADKGGTHCLVFGPYTSMPPARYRIDYALKVDPAGGTEDLVTVDVMERGARVLAQRVLKGDDFQRKAGYQTFSLTLDATEHLDQVEFRVITHGRAKAWVDYVDMVPLPQAEAVATRK